MTTRSLRWMAYARWQAVDALWQRLALPLGLTTLLTVAGFYSMKNMASGHPDFYTNGDGVRFSAMMLRQAMSVFIPLAVLMGTNGIVAKDRQKGFFRILFSKPVPVPGYYLSAYVIHAALATAGAALVAAAIGWYAAPQPVLGVAVACALTFALLGSLFFLLSTLTYLDGLLFILIWMLTLLSRQLEPAMKAGHWLHTAVRVLPPTHRLDSVRDALYSGQAWPAADAWHVLGYGGACLVLGLLALRRLPLAR
ncbi:MAG TPA: hypothetical protein VIK25_02290 [Gemmatimonadaceae bacterium]